MVAPILLSLALALDGRAGSSMGGFGSSMLTLSDSAILDRLKQLYATKLRPLERKSMYHELREPALSDAWFDARPMVLLIGNYSTGKTSFIKFLLEQEFPGMHIGPEPTTDRFQAIMYGVEERVLPGHALVSDPGTPYFDLAKFGNSFLSRFTGCEVPSAFARGITLVDTPGILAGKKQTDDRQYSFEAVVQWFAPRVDMILLMFDAHKVDISDEFRSVIQSLEGFDDKVRVVMSRADSLNPSSCNFPIIQLFMMYVLCARCAS